MPSRNYISCYESISSLKIRAAMANCWQARPPQWQPHQRHAAPATAAFYSVKSRQGLGLGGALPAVAALKTVS